MSAAIRCLVCDWQSRNINAVEDYHAHWCVKPDELEVSDKDWSDFLGRLAHPSLGGDAA